MSEIWPAIIFAVVLVVIVSVYIRWIHTTLDDSDYLAVSRAVLDELYPYHLDVPNKTAEAVRIREWAQSLPNGRARKAYLHWLSYYDRERRKNEAKLRAAASLPRPDITRDAK